MGRIALLLVLAAIPAYWWAAFSPFHWAPPVIEHNGVARDDDAVRFDAPSWLIADAADPVDAARAARHLRVRLSLESASAAGDASVLTIGRLDVWHGFIDVGLRVAQKGWDLHVFVRRPGAGRRGRPPIVLRGAATSTIDVLLTGRRLQIHYGEDLAVDEQLAADPFELWPIGASLTIGCDPHGGRAWSGTIRDVVLESGSSSTGLEQLAAPSWSVRWPLHVHRAASTWFLPWASWEEFGLNILAFVPLGIFAFRICRWRAVWLALAISLSMELGQFVFGARVPSILDLIANTGGGGLGALLGRAGWRARSIS